MTFGRMERICRSRNGWQLRISSGSGLRFCGGRHLITFPIHTSDRRIFRPFSMMSVRSWPARPTKARPCSSSSAPGASPTNMRAALGLPWPKTMFFRPPASLHRWQSPMNSRMAVRSSAGAVVAPSASGRGRSCAIPMLVSEA